MDDILTVQQIHLSPDGPVLLLKSLDRRRANICQVESIYSVKTVGKVHTV